MLLELVRQRLTAAGYDISPRDDIDAKAAAWFLGKAPKTLRNWRSQRRGPAYINLGCDVRYPLIGLLDYLESKVQLADGDVVG